MRNCLTALILAAMASTASAQTDTAATDYDTFIPTTELFTATGEPPETELVRRLFILAFTEPCSQAIDGGFGGSEAEVYDFTYRGTYDEPDDPDRRFRLYRFNCSGGAYNFSSVFYGWDEVSGLAPLSFAVPSILPVYKDLETNPDGTLIGLKSTGTSSRFLVTNADVDAETGAISSVAYWRGIGDASSSGVWTLGDGEYVLTTYDVDASYDGEINPVRVYDRTEPEDIALPQ